MLHATGILRQYGNSLSRKYFPSIGGEQACKLYQFHSITRKTCSTTLSLYFESANHYAVTP